MMSVRGRLAATFGLHARCCNLSVFSRGFHRSAVFWKDEKSITNTTIFVQDGTNIEELPAVVRIINGEFKLMSNSKSQSGRKVEGLWLEIPQVSKQIFKNINFEEEREMILGFMGCSKLTEIFKLLEICPENEVTPKVSLAVLKRIFELENNHSYRNEGLNQYPEETPFTFTRGAVMKRLVEIVCGSSDPQIVIDALQTMGRDTYQGDKLKYLESLCTECIVLVTEGKMNINQMCEAAKGFHYLGASGSHYIDQVWAGVAQKADDIQEKELCNIMTILPLLKKSQKHVYNIVERKMPHHWYKLQCEDIIRILHVLVQLKITRSQMLPIISKWTSLNIHVLTEGNLRWIIYSFLSLDYTNLDIQKALARYMKAKKTNIKDASLIAVIMDYCVKMRLRSTPVLKYAAEFFVQNSLKLTVPQINSICRSYGLLNYEPPNAAEFFQALEVQLDEKFAQFPPNIVIDLLLSCVYLKRYPLNFVKKVFNPYFFDKVHVLQAQEVALARTKLMVLDKALCLEASNYKGPMLPKDHSLKSYRRDSRIMRCVNVIQEPLIEIVGSGERLTPSVVLPNFPGTDLYIMDCVVDMAGKLSSQFFKWNNNRYAILVHVPEHYVLYDEILVGPQVMRKRHIALCGFKVVSLDSDKIFRFRMYPDLLKNYILEMMKQATY